MKESSNSEERRFNSPQEEALDIALKARRTIIDGEEDSVAVLRSCFVVAENLSRTKDLVWINSELGDGWNEKQGYRKIELPTEKDGLDAGFESVYVSQSLNNLHYFLDKGKNLTIVSDDKKTTHTLRPDHCNELIDKIMNKCLKFLTDCINRLQYSGYLQNLFEIITKKVDYHIKQLDGKISDELQSIYLNLVSKNSSDWIKVAHSCRRILKFMADTVFPPIQDQYKTKNGELWDVKDSNFLNRLICYFDSLNNSRIVKGEIAFIEKYIRAVNKEVQDGEHETAISHDEATSLAIHTYLILSEIVGTMKVTDAVTN